MVVRLHPLLSSSDTAISSSMASVESLCTIFDSHSIQSSASNTQKHPPRALGFLDLPGEIRNQIYRMVLTTKWAFKKAPYAHRFDSTCYELSPAILRANQQIYREARSILYDENLWIFLTVDSDIIRGGPGWNPPKGYYLPAVSYRETDSIERPALTINIRYHPYRSGAELKHYVLGPESIPYLIGCLYRRNNHVIGPQNNLSCLWFMFRLQMSAAWSKDQLQQTLLMPFSQVWYCGRVCIQGARREFKEMLYRDMRNPSNAFQRLVKITIEKLNLANELMNKNLVDEACYLNDQALYFLLHQRGRASATNNVERYLFTRVFVSCILYMAKGLILLQYYEDAYRILQAIRLQQKTAQEEVRRFFLCGLIKIAAGSIWYAVQPHAEITEPLHERLLRLDLSHKNGEITYGGQTNRGAHFLRPGKLSGHLLCAILYRHVRDGGVPNPGIRYPNFPVFPKYPRALIYNPRPLPDGAPQPLSLTNYRRREYYDLMVEAATYFGKAHTLQQTLDVQSPLPGHFRFFKRRLDNAYHFYMPWVLALQCKFWFGELDECDRWDIDEILSERMRKGPSRSFKGNPLESDILLDHLMDNWPQAWEAKVKEQVCKRSADLIS